MPFGKRLDGPGGRRTSARAPVLRAASVLTVDRSRIGSLVDISTSGAKLQGCSDLEVGQDLWLRVASIDTLATVAWKAEDICGLTFDAPLSGADVTHLQSESEWAMFTQLTPAERIAAGDWINNFVR